MVKTVKEWVTESRCVMLGVEVAQLWYISLDTRGLNGYNRTSIMISCFLPFVFS